MTRKPPPAAAKVLTVGTRQLAHARGLDLPAYQSDGAAGMDLIAAVDRRRPLQLAPGARALIPTGLVLDLPPGLEAQVRPRSGLALRHGVSVLNSPGTIDCDYRGEVKVLLANFSDQPFTICRGQRIAQLVFQPVARVSLKLIGKLSPTRRGAGGFGSTGVAGNNAAAPRPPRKRPRPAQRRPT
jgi:dUTP pyrophosphatase